MCIRDRDELVRLGRYPCLLVDEVGYIPFEPEAANLFFQLASSRHERASLIVTSNKAFGRQGEKRQPQQSRTEPSPGRQRTHPVALSYSPTPEGIASVKCRLGRPRSARRRDEHRDSRRGRACRSPRYGMLYPIRVYTITKVSSRSAATRLV